MLQKLSVRFESKHLLRKQLAGKDFSLLGWLPVASNEPRWLTETFSDHSALVAGVNLMAMEQLAPPAPFVPQLLTSAQSPEFVPVIEIPELVRYTVGDGHRAHYRRNRATRGDV